MLVDATPEEEQNSMAQHGLPPAGGNPSDIELRFIILDSHAGGIIGKGGHYIKKIRTESEGDFQLYAPVKDAYIRLGEIKGNVDQVKTALDLLLQKLVELHAEDDQDKTRDQGQDYVAFTFLLERKNCGCIIGTKGAKISHTRQETGAMIKISSEPLPESSEKSVEIKGTKEQVHQVLNIMLEQISTNEKHSHTVRKFEIKEQKPFDYGRPYGYGPPMGGPPGGPGGRPNNGWITSNPRAPAGVGGPHMGRYGFGFNPYGRPPAFRNNPYRGHGKNQWKW